MDVGIEPMGAGIRPTEFKVLVLPAPVEEKKGSILMPDLVKDQEKYATTEGTIIAVSPLAFSYATAEEWSSAGAQKPRAGDRVVFAKNSGMRRKGRDGKEYLLVNDKDVLALIEE